MLFWIVLILAVMLAFGAMWCYDHDWDALFAASLTSCLALVITFIIMGVCIICSHVSVDGYVTQMNARYDALMYQHENNIYDNDNDLGKRDLIVDIQSWNEDLAYRKEAQDNFWIGIFYPNIYDQFEFVPYSLG